MKNKHRFIILTVLVLSGEAIFFAPSVFSAPSYPVSIALPAASVDLSDLDLRDANNRPVRSAQAVRQMQSIFVNGLNDLLLNNLTPARRYLVDRLSHTWDLISGWLKKAANNAVCVMWGWLKDRKEKKPVMNFGSLPRAPINSVAAEFAGSHADFSFLLSCISSTRLLL